MKFETRTATLDDRDQLFELYVSVLKDHIIKIWGWEESWQQADFDEHFTPEQIRVIVVDDKSIGYIHVEKQGQTPHIRMICIHPEYQRNGIGTALIKTLIQECSAKQQDVALGVFQINTNARRLYERLGFELCGKTETHYEMKRKA